jgi:hypothetical protein
VPIRAVRRDSWSGPRLDPRQEDEGRHCHAGEGGTAADRAQRRTPLARDPGVEDKDDEQEDEMAAGDLDRHSSNGIELSKRSGRRDHEGWLWQDVGRYGYEQGKLQRTSLSLR